MLLSDRWRTTSDSDCPGGIPARWSRLEQSLRRAGELQRPASGRRPLLTDFGLAHLLGERASRDDASTITGDLTTPGERRDTMLYRPVLGRRAGRASDIFSCGSGLRMAGLRVQAVADPGAGAATARSPRRHRGQSRTRGPTARREGTRERVDDLDSDGLARESRALRRQGRRSAATSRPCTRTTVEVSPWRPRSPDRVVAGGSRVRGDAAARSRHAAAADSGFGWEAEPALSPTGDRSPMRQRRRRRRHLAGRRTRGAACDGPTSSGDDGAAATRTTTPSLRVGRGGTPRSGRYRPAADASYRSRRAGAGDLARRPTDRLRETRRERRLRVAVAPLDDPAAAALPAPSDPVRAIG